jgi:Protein of unknown function (DUF1279)
MMGIDVTLDQMNPEIKSESVGFADPRLETYDPQTSCSTACHMQSTVPEPFGGNNKFSHLNMPGGSWGQQTKYLSHELNSAHYTQLRQDVRQRWYSMTEEEKGKKSVTSNSVLNRSLLNHHHKCLLDHNFIIINKRFISLSSNHLNTENKQQQQQPGESPEKESGKLRLKKAVKEYGTTVIVFHVGISLISLGMFYGLVSR